MTDNFLYGPASVSESDSNQELFYAYIREQDLSSAERVLSTNPYLKELCDLKVLLELQLCSFIQKYIKNPEPYDMKNLLKVHTDYRMPVAASIVNNLDLLSNTNFNLYHRMVLADGFNNSYDKYKYAEHARQNIVPAEGRFMEIFSDEVRKDIKNPSNVFIDSLATIAAAKLTKDIEEVFSRKLKCLSKNTFISCVKGERGQHFHLLVPGGNTPLCKDPSLFGELTQAITPRVRLCQGCYMKNNLTNNIETYNAEYISKIFNQDSYNLIQNVTKVIMRENISSGGASKSSKSMFYKKPKEEIYKTVLKDPRTKDIIRHMLKNYTYGDYLVEEDNLIELDHGVVQI